MKIFILICVLLLSACGGSGDSAPVAALSEPTVCVPAPVFIGDSITANWPSAVKNYGVAGENSDSIRARLGEVIRGCKPEFLHILAGTNDDIRSPYRTVDNIVAMVAYAKSMNVVVIVGTIPPYDKNHFWQAPYASQFNAALKIKMKEIGVEVVDYYSMLVKEDGSQNEILFLDGIHPNDAGYKKMNSVLAKSGLIRSF